MWCHPVELCRGCLLLPGRDSCREFQQLSTRRFLCWQVSTIGSTATAFIAHHMHNSAVRPTAAHCWGSTRHAGSRVLPPPQRPPILHTGGCCSTVAAVLFQPIGSRASRICRRESRYIQMCLPAIHANPFCDWFRSHKQLIHLPSAGVPPHQLVAALQGQVPCKLPTFLHLMLGC